MIDVAHLCGTFVDPRQTDAVCKSLDVMGIKPMFADAQPQLKGHWEATGRRPIFLTDADSDPAWHQDKGTCCGQAFGRGTQSMIRWTIKLGSRIGRSDVEIAWEANYIDAKLNPAIGNRALPTGEGCCVPWIFMSGVLTGLLIRGKYASVDLTTVQEMWAWSNSERRSKPLPADLVAEMSKYKMAGAHKIQSIEEAADALAAKYFLERGADRATGAKRDADGMTGTVPCGGHAEHICCLFVDRKGDRVWGERNSWRGSPSSPHGESTFKLADGSEKPVPDGVGGIRDEDIQYYIRTGDLWAGAPPLNCWGWDSVKPSDLVQ